MNVKTPIVVGSALFAAVAAATVPDHVRTIESDIAERASSALSRSGVKADVDVDGRDVVLSGGAASARLRDRAIRVVSELAGVRSVAFAGAAAATAAKSTLQSEGPAAAAPRRAAPVQRVNVELRADRTVTMTGHAPSESIKGEWLEAARRHFSEGEVRDRLSIGEADESLNLKVGVLQGLAALRRLEEGRLSVTDRRIRVSGKARDKAMEEQIRVDLASRVPPALRVAIDVYSPRPRGGAAGEPAVVRSTITRGRGDVVILSGIAASEEIKEAWLAKAREVYPGERVRDRLLVRAIDPPAEYEACLLAAMPWVGELINGRVEVNKGNVRVFGKAHSQGAADSIKSSLEESGCKVDLARLAVLPNE